ncbi:hypothetical protein DICVIV_12671 [Dictyocaulus viviparus]|uniref:G-protein coupled receptors family 1 profile domain-containing protein n=1 Tax=Dictyocaulus viviparus TaxID=29172 RepID=A0A0D8XC66_DICVI|nr:hypothetical protein DICVIV_12671 [Dictyocaulus viviparus]
MEEFGINRYGDICILASFFGIAPTTVSVFSMMALSWDRCQAVVWPLKKRPLSRRCSLITIALIWTVSTASALPFAFAATSNDFRHSLSSLIFLTSRSTNVAADSNSKRSKHSKAKNKVP